MQTFARKFEDFEITQQAVARIPWGMLGVPAVFVAKITVLVLGKIVRKYDIKVIELWENQKMEISFALKHCNKTFILP